MCEYAVAREGTATGHYSRFLFPVFRFIFAFGDTRVKTVGDEILVVR